jgi:hypothetical protein
MKVSHLIAMFLMTVCASFAEGIGFWKKVEREMKRVQDQIEENPVKVFQDVLQFVDSPEETGTRVLKRILKNKEDKGFQEAEN